MIFYSGFDSAIDQLQGGFPEHVSFNFVPVFHPEEIADLNQADLFVIGPDEIDPIALVQKIASKDRHLSILILAEKARCNRIKQALQFSPFVGKNTTCIVFDSGVDYSSVFETAKKRTIQKRSFSQLDFSSSSRLTNLSSAASKLGHIGQALEYAPVGALLLDAQGNVTGANIRARKMFNQLGAGEVRLEKIFSESATIRIQALISKGNGEAIEIGSHRGSFYEITVSGFSETREFQTILLVNDISERREKDKRLEAILESLPQMAWTASADGDINYYTNGWYNYTNQTPEQALGEGWISVVHPDDKKLTLSRWIESVKNHKVYQHASRFRRFDGEYRWHLSRAVPVYSIKKTLSMWVGTSTDIHDQALLAENLEKKVMERTRSLQAAKEELEQFTYVSSHDLQEPLRKIQAFADLVRENNYASLDDSSRRYIDKIIGTAARMSKLLKDLLNFTRLHHQDSVSQVDLNEIIAEIRDDLELAISRNHATIRVEKLPIVQGYAPQLKQLFFNMINNSLKFRKPDISPIIKIRAQLTHSNGANPRGGEVYWELVISDNGIGFEQKYADQIFTIFQRLHNRSAYEGTGIGLAICKKVVSNHGGRIFANSAHGQGAEFHIILPIRQMV